MPVTAIRQQAKLLASENRRAEPDIQKVYWFPDDDEVRLVGITPSIPPSGDGKLHPFYFHPDAAKSLPAPSRIALIRPDEVEKLQLPSSWGGWSDAVEIDENGQ